jgi:hypothetical protein
MTTWAARCPLCGNVLCKDSTNEEAQAEVDLHLTIVHGIEVDS